MNARNEARALYEFLAARGMKPSARAICRTLRDMGLRFRDDDVRDGLREYIGTHPGRVRLASGTQKPSVVDALALRPDCGRDASTRAAADQEEFLDSAQGVDRKDTPPSPSDSIPPADPVERFMAEGTAPALFAVPDARPPVPKASGPKRVAMASRFAEITIAHFGPFEPQVSDLLAVEADIGSRDGKLGEKTLTKLLQRLALWRETYGDDAFANGLRVGIETGKGVAYGGGAMRNFDPEREAMRRPRFEPAPNPSDELPTLTDLVREGKVEPYRQSAAEFAKLPPGLQAQILEQRRLAGIATSA